MNFTPRKRRQSVESIIPMINVVFLLLIFFLMTAEISPPDPFEVSLPFADEEQEPLGDIVLYLSKDALLGFEGVTGAEALEALRIKSDKISPLQLRADGGIKATEVAKTLRTLTELGFLNVEVMVGG